MRHVYLFTSYSNSRNLCETINKLNSENAEFIVHLSSVVNIEGDNFLQRLTQQKNVTFIEDRIKVNWGGFSHFQAIIKLMKKAIASTDADYFHLLSDSCYPICTSEEIDDFFHKNKGKEFIEYESLPSKAWSYGGLVRTDYYHLHDVLNLKQNPLYWRLNEGLTHIQRHLGLKRKNKLNWGAYYGGSTWWSLSRDAVVYCMERMNSREFDKTFRHTFCAEETIMQTILVNSRFKEAIVNNNVRYIVWEERNGNMPANLDSSDFEKLVNSDNLFARKFVSAEGEKLRRMIDNHLELKGTRKQKAK